MKGRVIRVIVHGLDSLTVFAMALMRWCVSHSPEVRQKVSAAVVEPSEYIPPSLDSVNSILLNAVHDEHVKSLEQDHPEEAQAVLNACLESLRNCESVRRPMFHMFAALIANGYDPEEAFLRVSANILMLGMNVQKRLAPAPGLEMPGEFSQEAS